MGRSNALLVVTLTWKESRPPVVPRISTLPVVGRFAAEARDDSWFLTSRTVAPLAGSSQSRVYPDPGSQCSILRILM